MEFYEVVSTRRTVRELKADPIPADVLERIITAGLAAPTNNHQREWEFIVLREQAEKENALQFVKQWSASQEENNAVSALGSPRTANVRLRYAPAVFYVGTERLRDSAVF